MSPPRPSCGCLWWRRFAQAHEALLLPDDPIIVLQLDALAERERHRRRTLLPPAQAR